MTTAAEQYRRLVAKLESINPSEPVNEADNIDPNAAPAQGAMNVASDNIPQASAVPQAAADAIPTIGGSFKQAYAQAAKQGLKQFKWCGTYTVRAPSQGARPGRLPDKATSDFGVKPAGSGYDVDPNAPGVTNYSGMGVPGS